jgi:protein-S-isoprenylcysteine O-methyltransferase Ste14
MLFWQWIYFIVVPCWAVLVLAWLKDANYHSCKVPSVQERRGWTTFLLIVIALAFLLRLLLPKENWLWGYVTFQVFWLQFIGAILLVAATVYALWVCWELRKIWSDSAGAKVGPGLYTTGPYRLSRHPIFTSILAMLVSSVLLLGLSPGVAYIMVWRIFFETKFTFEERLMKETFGEQYLEYQRRVPQVIPGLQFFTRVDS